MYLMFVAAGASESGMDSVHLVEWRSEKRDVVDVEEEFQTALDSWARERPWMGDWSMIHALTVVNGKIVPVKQSKDDSAATDSRTDRIMRAITSRMGVE